MSQSSNDIIYLFYLQNLKMLNAGTAFGIVALLWQICLGLLYGFFLDYLNDATTISTAVLGVGITSLAIIMLLAGFGLIAGYVRSVSFTSIAFTLIIFAFTFQNYFIFKTFWEKADVPGFSDEPRFEERFIEKIAFFNFNDLENEPARLTQWVSYSALEAVAMSLSAFIIFSGVIGRVSALGVFVITLMNSFSWEILNGLFFKFYITDSGFSMRTFLFGGVTALIVSILSKDKRTAEHPNYFSTYRIQALSFLGAALVWCIFPIFAMTDIYTFTTDDNVKLAVYLNMVWAMAAGTVAGFISCAFIYAKFMVHDIVFSVAAGVVTFAASADVYYNPGYAMALGFSGGFIASVAHSVIKKKINKNAVLESNSYIFSFIIPGVLASITSALVQAAANGSLQGVEQFNMDFGITVEQQGGFQIIGMLLTLAFAIGTGLFIGILVKLGQDRVYFTDVVYYGPSDTKHQKQERASARS